MNKLDNRLNRQFLERQQETKTTTKLAQEETGNPNRPVTSKEI